MVPPPQRASLFGQFELRFKNPTLPKVLSQYSWITVASLLKTAKVQVPRENPFPSPGRMRNVPVIEIRAKPSCAQSVWVTGPRGVKHCVPVQATPQMQDGVGSVQALTCLFIATSSTVLLVSETSASVNGLKGVLMRALAHSKKDWLTVTPFGAMTSLEDVITRSAHILLLPSAKEKREERKTQRILVKRALE